MADLARLYDFVNGTVADAEQIDAEFNQLIARINALEPDSMNSVVADALGLSQTGTVRRGKSIISTPETRTNTAYGLMTTPDRVSGVVLPAGGLIVVSYLALWRETVANAARAAIFLNANQLCAPQHGGAAPQAARSGSALNGAQNHYRPLSSAPVGLVSLQGDDTLDTSFVDTGMALVASDSSNLEARYELSPTLQVTANAPMGGFCLIQAAAGTYDVSVQFKASSGDVLVKERNLRVWTLGF